MKKIFITLVLLGSFSAIAKDSSSFRTSLKHQVNYSIGHDFSEIYDQYSYSFFVTPNNIIGLRAGKSHYDEDEFATTLFGKRFYGNSFYTQIGISYLNSKFDDYSGHSISKPNNGIVKRSYAGVSGNIRIGNQWQWDNLTIGCDWVGVSKHKEIEKDLNVKGPNITVTTLNMYMGLSF
jgi:hypothetical protein